MGTEDATSNADNNITECAEGVKYLKGYEVEVADGNGIAVEPLRLKSEAGTNGVAIADGNDVAGEILLLKNVAIGNVVAIVDGNGVAEQNLFLKSEAVTNGVEITGGNDVIEEALHLKSEAITNGLEIADGNDVIEEGSHLKSEAFSTGVAVADGNGVAKETRLLKSEAINNGAAISDGFNSADRDSGGLECFQTYKRRKHVKSSSRSKVQEDYRECVDAASHLADQVLKQPCHVALGNTSDGYSHGHWGKVVLKQLYQSLGDGNGGLEGCIREALMHHPKMSCATAATVMETSKIDKDGQECYSQLEQLSQRTRSEDNGHANVMHNGCTSEQHRHGVTEMCQRMLCNILTSEKFSSLCKALLENFQGMKPENAFDFGVMNSRMKEHAYEQSPILFLSDIQQVWRKLQDTGNEIVALAKSLSHLSRTSYCELFHNQESDPHMKPEQIEEYATFKVQNCSHCGDMADSPDCLVCDSCQAMYHVSCVEPAVKEMPHKSWYCANCSASGSGSTHENCGVCERLNVPKTLNMVGDECLPTNEEKENEVEENSNCTFEGIQMSVGGKNSLHCRICGIGVDGENIKICGHPFCPNKYYHVRCLSSKQLKSYCRRWYCPSCLCRVCLADQDDDKIVLCDGCDHAYHIYCMKPPRTSIPRRKWFCSKCDAGIQAIRRAKKAYEKSNKWRRAIEDVSKPSANLEKKSTNKRVRELEKGGGMDMLLTAANSLNFEENLVAIQIDSQRA